MKSAPSVLVIGSSNTDMTIRVNQLPKPGETVLGNEFAIAPGGKGANQAVGAARAGGAVTFISCIGRDIFGDQAIQRFVNDGINVDSIVRDETTPSGVALIFVGENGQNSIAVAGGSNGKLTPADLKNFSGAFRKADFVVLQLETPMPTVEAAAELATQSGARVVLNPAPAQKLSDHLLRRVFVLTPNESEAELLTGVAVTNCAAAEKAAAILMKQGVQNVIITMGSQGAYVANKDGAQMIPAYKVKAIDAIAAGDVFNGTLAVALAEGKSLFDAARFANAAAAISVTRKGAQSSAPARKEIEQMLATGKIGSLLETVTVEVSGNGHGQVEVEPTIATKT